MHFQILLIQFTVTHVTFPLIGGATLHLLLTLANLALPFLCRHLTEDKVAMRRNITEGECEFHMHFSAIWSYI